MDGLEYIKETVNLDESDAWAKNLLILMMRAQGIGILSMVREALGPNESAKLSPKVMEVMILSEDLEVVWNSDPNSLSTTEENIQKLADLEDEEMMREVFWCGPAGS